MSQPAPLLPAPSPSAAPITRLGRVELGEDDPLFLGLLSLNSVVASVFMVVVHAWELPPAPVDAADVRRLLRDLPPVEIVRPDPVAAPGPETPAPAPRPASRPTPPPTALPDPGPNVAQPGGRLQDSLEQLSAAALGIQQIGSAGDVLVELAGRATQVDGPAGTGPAFMAGTAQSGSGPVVVGPAGGGDARTSDVEKIDLKRRFRAEPPPADTPFAEGVQAAVGAQRRGLESCVEAALRLDPTLQGRVSFSWTVAKGRVQGLEVRESSGNTELDRCMSRSLSRLSFPSSAQGDVDAYTFILSGR